MQTVSPLAPNNKFICALNCRLSACASKLPVESPGPIPGDKPESNLSICPQHSATLAEGMDIHPDSFVRLSVFPGESVSGGRQSFRRRNELLFSAPPRPAIQLEPPPSGPTAVLTSESSPVKRAAPLVPDSNFAERARETSGWPRLAVRRPALRCDVDGRYRRFPHLARSVCSRRYSHGGIRSPVLVSIRVLVQQHPRRASGQDGLRGIRKQKARPEVDQTRFR